MQVSLLTESSSRSLSVFFQFCRLFEEGVFDHTFGSIPIVSYSYMRSNVYVPARVNLTWKICNYFYRMNWFQRNGKSEGNGPLCSNLHASVSILSVIWVCLSTGMTCRIRSHDNRFQNPLKITFQITMWVAKYKVSKSMKRKMNTTPHITTILILLHFLVGQSEQQECLQVLFIRHLLKSPRWYRTYINCCCDSITFVIKFTRQAFRLI